MILPVKFSGVSSTLYNKIVTSSLSCSEFILWKYSTRIPSAHRRFWQSFCNLKIATPNLCSHASLDSEFWRIFPRHNTASVKTWTFVRLKLMIPSSPIKDNYFHEWFSQPCISNPEISSCSDTDLVDVSNVCLSLRSVLFEMNWQLFK